MDRRRFLPTYHYEDNTNGVLLESVGKPLRDYKIYGNSEQSGTPSPEAPVEIMSVGDKTKNLFEGFDVAYCPGSTYSISGNSVTFNPWSTTAYFSYISCYMNNVKLGCTYTISCDIDFDTASGAKPMLRIGYHRADGTFAYLKNKTTATVGRHNLTFTLPAVMPEDIETSGRFVVFYNYTYVNATSISDLTLSNFQLEEGETETAYEPYGYKVPIKVIGKNLLNEPYKDLGTTNIYLDEPLRKAVDIADYVDFKNGKVVRALDCLTFDGTEDWRAAAEIVYMNLPKTASGDYVYEFGKNGISTHLKAGADTKTDGELYFSPVGSVLRVHKKNGTYTDVDGWKTFLAEEYAKGNPVQLITPFKTPTEEPIELPTIPTAKGIVNIIVNTDVQPSGAVWQYYGE